MGAFELLVEAYRPALKAVLANLVRLLEGQNVPYVIAGANALSLYVRPRMTIDVDVLVDQARKADSDSPCPPTTSRARGERNRVLTPI
jgi:hypothetical protein